MSFIKSAINFRHEHKKFIKGKGIGKNERQKSAGLQLLTFGLTYYATAQLRLELERYSNSWFLGPQLSNGIIKTIMFQGLRQWFAGFFIPAHAFIILAAQFVPLRHDADPL